jgi:hypothetical protein
MGSRLWHGLLQLATVVAVITAVLALRATNESLKATRESVDTAKSQAAFERRPILVNVPYGGRLAHPQYVYMPEVGRLRLYDGQAAEAPTHDALARFVLAPIQNVGRGVAHVTNVWARAGNSQSFTREDPSDEVQPPQWPYIAAGRQAFIRFTSRLQPPETEMGFNLMIDYEDIAGGRFRTAFSIVPQLEYAMQPPPYKNYVTTPARVQTMESVASGCRNRPRLVDELPASCWSTPGG